MNTDLRLNLAAICPARNFAPNKLLRVCNRPWPTGQNDTGRVRPRRADGCQGNEKPHLCCMSTPLTNAYAEGILRCMRTTLNIDEAILSRASELTGVREKTALVRMGLEALIARASAARLAALGGTEKRLKPIPRRKGQ